MVPFSNIKISLGGPLLEYQKQPKEVEGVIPTNSESTLTYIQALRVYLRYRFNNYYPSSSWLS